MATNVEGVKLGFCLEIFGENACFTRPEFKVERVSYDVITPSAARGVFEAVLWKPSIAWEISRIEVLNPIRFEGIRRNEVASVIPLRNVTTVMNGGEGRLELSIEADRQQRASLLLKDVRYRIHGRFRMTRRAGEDESPEKFANMFRRRAEKGQCFLQPYLGCREFSAGFRLIESPSLEPPPLVETRDLGWMFYDMDFTDERNPKPLFFRAQMTNGVIDVPSPAAAEVRR